MFWGGEHLFEEWLVDDVVPLVDPEELHLVVLAVGDGSEFEDFELLVDGGDDGVGGVGVEFDFGEPADVVLGFLEQLHECLDRGAVDFFGRQQRAVRVGEPVDAAVLVVAIRVAQVVLEVAGHSAVQDHGVACLEAGADLVLTSIGALVDDALRARLYAAAEATGRRLVLASAGIGALDILSAAAVGGLDRVRITVRKDASAWYGTEAETVCDLGRLSEPTVLYRGAVRGGAARYPQNVNIAAATALAGIGLDRTELVIVADPTIVRHVIEIEAEGAFGRFTFVEEVTPSAANPKTGDLVAMAVIKTLRQLAAPVVVGG